MKTTITILLSVIASVIIAQTSWINYSTDFIIWDIAIEDEYAWVGAQGGLFKLNIETGEKQIFQSWNSPFQGLGVKDIEIAEDGTKWIGGENAGLFRYDDTNWEHFYFINTGDTLIEVINIESAPNGDVWFLSNIQGSCWGCRKFFSYDGEIFTNHSDKFPLTTYGSTTVSEYDFTQSGDLWVSTGKKLFRYDGEILLDSFDYSNMPMTEDDGIRKIAVDLQGDLWVVIGSQILKYDGNNWTVVNDDLPGEGCSNLFLDDSGSLYFEFYGEINEPRSVAKYDGNNWMYWTVDDLPDNPATLLKPILHDVDSEGNWWMSSFNENDERRVYRVGQDSWTSYDTEIFPLLSNYVDAISFDCENNVWIANDYKGLIKIDGSNWEDFTSNETGIVGSVQSIFLDTITCDMWFAVRGDAGMVRYDGESFESFPIIGEEAMDINVTPDGTIYVASMHAGLGRYMNGSWLWFNESNSPLSDWATFVEVESNGTIWVGTWGNGLGRRVGTTWTIFNSSNSPLDDTVWWILIDHEGMVWARQDAGLARYDGNNWEIFPISTAPGGVIRMTQDALNNYWLGTASGAYYWNGFDFTIYDVSNSDIASNVVWEGNIDVYGNVWFRHGKGISVFKYGGIPGKYANQTIAAHGIVYYDANQDGTYDIGEDVRIPDQKVWLLPDSTQALTNSIGAFSYYPDTGSYQIMYEPINPWESTSPQILDFELEDETISDLNFGVWTNEIPEKVSIDITVGQPVCNQEFNVWITLRNEGWEAIEGNISLIFNPEFTYVSSLPEANNIENGEVTWSFSDLGFMEPKVFKAVLQAPGVEFFGVPMNFIVETENESESFTEVILCSYDPNDKTANPTGEYFSIYSLLEDPLEYTIRFQNLGNYMAYDVEIKDTLDASLDLSTFRVISSSHEVYTTLESEGIIIFRFEGIDLPPEEQDYLGSQGYVKYQISPLSSLPDPTTIFNSASIYFDFNPAIVTNTTENILVDSLPTTSVSGLEKQQEVLIFPNPASSSFWIEWINDETISIPWEISVFDLSGKLLQQKSTNQTKYEVSNLEQGFYLLIITKGDVTLTKKIVIINE